MRAGRVLAAAILGVVLAGLAAPPAVAAEETVLTYSVRDARAYRVSAAATNKAKASAAGRPAAVK